MPIADVATLQKQLARGKMQRLGYVRGAREVMEQPFFRDIKLGKLYRRDHDHPLVLEDLKHIIGGQF